MFSLLALPHCVTVLAPHEWTPDACTSCARVRQALFLPFCSPTALAQYDSDAGYEGLANSLLEYENSRMPRGISTVGRLLYLALPPSVYPQVCNVCICMGTVCACTAALELLFGKIADECACLSTFLLSDALPVL